VTASPYVLSLPQQPARARWSVTRTFRLTSRRPRVADNVHATAELDAKGLRATVRPEQVALSPRGIDPVPLEVTVSSPGPQPPGYVTGRIRIRGSGLDMVVPFGVAVGAPPPPRLGELQLVSQGGRVVGVRFTAGAVDPGHDGIAVEPLASLELELEPVARNASERRVLTPPGGAPDLLPGEYAYTLPGGIRRGLAPGQYRFTARARAAAGGPPLTRQSPPFRIP
jgi:hypothetical protein